MWKFLQFRQGDFLIGRKIEEIGEMHPGKPASVGLNLKGHKNCL